MEYRDDEVLVMTSTSDLEKLTECLLDLNLSVITLQTMVKQLVQKQAQEQIEPSALDFQLDADEAAQLLPKKVLH